MKADHVFLSCLPPDHCDLHVVQLIRLKEGSASECSSANPFQEDSTANLTLNEAKVKNKEYMRKAYLTVHFQTINVYVDWDD